MCSVKAICSRTEKVTVRGHGAETASFLKPLRVTSQKMIKAALRAD